MMTKMLRMVVEQEGDGGERVGGGVRGGGGKGVVTETRVCFPFWGYQKGFSMMTKILRLVGEQEGCGVGGGVGGLGAWGGGV